MSLQEMEQEIRLLRKQNLLLKMQNKKLTKELFKTKKESENCE